MNYECIDISSSDSDETSINENSENSNEEINECSTDSVIDEDYRNDSQLLEKSFVCNVSDCGKSFRKKLYYDIHFGRCHSKNTFHCKRSECYFVTGDKQVLNKHMKIHNYYRPFACNIDDCEKTFTTNVGLKKHKSIKHSSGLFRCTHEGCDKTFKFKSSLKLHINDKHSSKAKPYVCRACGKGFETRVKRVNHKRRDHQMVFQPIICRVNNCNKKFHNQYIYKLHVQCNHSSQEYRCHHSGCDYVTKSLNFMNRHVKKHLDIRPFVCGIDGCVKAFKENRHLTIHKRTHSSERFRCTEDGCRQAFRRKEYLEQHMDSIHSEMSCKYEDCKYVFRSKDKYEIHLTQSHDVGPLSCDQPNGDYTSDPKQNVESHPKVCTNDWPFFCDTYGCGMFFKRKVHLQRHKRTHYKTMIVCPHRQCRIIFNDKKILKHHFDKYHLQLTLKYRCEWPECRFTTDKYHLYYYHKAVHIGDRFECPNMECEETFDTQHELKVHKKIHRQTNN